MSEINQKFKVKKGLDVTGDGVISGNLSVAGVITVPTLSQSDNSTNVATTAYVKNAIGDLVNNSPAALDTLNELAAALGNDANFSTTMTNTLATKAPLASPALTGTPTSTTAARGTNTTQIATTAFVYDGLSLKADLDSPILTGSPKAPTAAADTNTTQIASTAFVLGQGSGSNPLMNGSVAAGTSTKFSRADHVHPSDTSKASLSGANFTGNVDTTGVLSVTKAALEADLDLNSANAKGRLFFKSSDMSLGLYVTDSSGNNGTTRLRITGHNGKITIGEDGTGNVLVGTSTDNGSDKLQVNGTVLATTFKGSAALTGTPTAPTAPANTNSTQIATTAYVDEAIALKGDSNNPFFTGDAVFAGAVSTHDYKLFLIPENGRYTTTTASVTGAFKIVLPVLYTNNFVSMVVKVYENVSGRQFDLYLSGHITASTWANCTALIVGDAGAKTPNIRFGNDSTNNCIWIGDVTDIWTYPQLSVVEVQVGLNTPTSAWQSAWSIAPVLSYDTVKVGPVTPSKTATLNSPAFTGVPTAPTAAANNNSTQIATTAYVDASCDLKAPLASPALTGTPTAPTATTGNNSTQIATTAFVQTAIDNLVGSAPTALDTLNELSAALGNDANFATTVTNSLATKAPIASPTFTGIVTTDPTLVVRGGGVSAEGGQLVLGYGNALANNINAQSNNTWNIEVDSSNAFRIFRQNASGTQSVVISIDEATGKPTINNSVDLTGSPTTTTGSAGSATTQIANGTFVHAAIRGTLTKAITGNVTLAGSEATYRNIIFTGTLTANTTVTFPTISNKWLVENRTTGAFTLTVKYASGTGITVAQNTRTTIFGDSTNIYRAETDYTNVALLGIPTAPTATSGTNTTQLATTAFVKTEIANSGLANPGGDTTQILGMASFTPSIQLNTNWTDTGVQGTSLATGSYMVQVFANDSAVGGGHNNEYYTGQVSWYSGDTNSTQDDEIILHRAGVDPGVGGIYLRTLRTLTGGGGMKLQISGDTNNSASSVYTIKFRRLI